MKEIPLGERLERELWNDMKSQNMQAIESKIAKGFLSVHDDGTRDRDEEIRLLRALNLGDYTLKDFKVTREGPTIMVTYMICVEETIEGKRLSKAPSPRSSVWLMTENGWQWITHANLNPVKGNDK